MEGALMNGLMPLLFKYAMYVWEIVQIFQMQRLCGIFFKYAMYVCKIVQIFQICNAYKREFVK